MTEEEQNALDILKEHKFRIYRAAFSQFRNFRRADEKLLKAGGHKTREAAILWAVEYHLKELLKLEEAHLARFPD
jgi:hypothetical protein